MAHIAAVITTLAAHPQRLLLVDGAGALVTAIAVGLVMPELPRVSGMPVPLLRALAMAAFLLAVWSLSCAALAPRRWPGRLRGLALMNAGYCAVTAACLWRSRAQLQPLDVLYFPAEIVLLLALIALEWQVASRGPATPDPFAVKEFCVPTPRTTAVE